MRKIEMQYFDEIKLEIKKKISEDINSETIYSVLIRDLAFHLNDQSSSNFQIFYFKSIDNYDYYFNSNDFFRQFKIQYSLQGITNQYLDFLENNKKEIYHLIKGENLSELYFKYFGKAKIEQRNGIVIKNLGSFFVKLVHTFQPNKYCALDNPIKNYFGLNNESFFVAFAIISKSYNQWIKQNKPLIRKIRDDMKKIDSNNVIDFDKLTDFKILDLIFWKKANA